MNGIFLLPFYAITDENSLWSSISYFLTNYQRAVQDYDPLRNLYAKLDSESMALETKAFVNDIMITKEAGANNAQHIAPATLICFVAFVHVYFFGGAHRDSDLSNPDPENT